MNFILKISPPFLRKLDAYLRINHSWVWTTKIHIHVYMAVILGAVFSFVGLLYQIDITDVPQSYSQDTFYMILFVPATVFYLYMLFNMSLFNADKSFAYRFRYQEFFLFLIYFFTFCLPLIIPYSASLILNERIANLVEDRQFEQDKNQYNEALPFLPSSQYGYSYYPSDSIYLYETRAQQKAEKNNDYNYESERYQYRQWESLRDSIYWHGGIFEKIRPKLYYHSARLWSNNWNGGYYYWGGMDKEDLDYLFNTNKNDSLYSLYLEKVNLAHDGKVAEKYIAEMEMLLKKYSNMNVVNRKKLLFDYVNNNYKPEDNFPAQQLTLATDITTNNITGINSAKLRYVLAWSPRVWWILIIFVFCFTILFQLFKNVHWKQLLLTIAIGAALMTLLIIIEVVGRFRGEFFATTGVVLPFAFLVLSAWGFSIKKFSWIFNQANIFLTLMLPFYPMIVLGYLSEYHHIFKISYFDSYLELHINANGKEWVYNEAYYKLVALIWQCAFWSGILFYLFVWNSYLKLLYLRYWSLPKNR